ncbi:superfamily I DNA and RNA helicases [Acidaminococcus sp. CAG:917]|nr:superfamily I DNA and RNA helicases [Acidaminococcus sp. CAG:917]
MKNKFIIACAGSGKTTKIVKDSLQSSDSILITTFTDENCDEIRRKFYKINGFIPANVEILPWFTFELRHLINPFLLPYINTDIKGINLVSYQSAPYTNQQSQNHYLDSNNRIYSDKIALLAYNTIIERKDKIINRLNRLFKKIYIDEFQDFAGYDLEIVKVLMQNRFTITLVGDPRQKTYTTHFSRKNKKYENDKEGFIRNECEKYCEVDSTTLNNSYRCPESIITYASKMFPSFAQSHSNSQFTEGDGLYFVLKQNISTFLQQEQETVQLRLNSKTCINNTFKVMTFGKSKGSTYENVLIYPTKKIKQAFLLNDFKYIDSPLTLCKCYVALTRAKHKVGIVIENNDLSQLHNPHITVWDSH